MFLLLSFVVDCSPVLNEVEAYVFIKSSFLSASTKQAYLRLLLLLLFFFLFSLNNYICSKSLYFPCGIVSFSPPAQRDY